MTFRTTDSCVFVTGAHLSREAAFLAAARLRVKPTVLQSPWPQCALITQDRRQAQALVADAKAVDVLAWTLTDDDVQAVERATRVQPIAEGVELICAVRVRRVNFRQLTALIDLRWKAAEDRRIAIIVPDDAPRVLVVASELTVTGPSKLAAQLQTMVELHRSAAALAPERVRSTTLTPPQLSAPPDLPALVVAMALAEAFSLPPRR